MACRLGAPVDLNVTVAFLRLSWSLSLLFYIILSVRLSIHVHLYTCQICVVLFWGNPT